MIDNKEEPKRKIVQLYFRPAYSLKDQYYNLKQARKSVICHAFGDDSDKMDYTLEDVVSKYRNLADSEEVNIDCEIKQFVATIRNWRAEKTQMKHQLSEKERLRKALLRCARQAGGKVLFDLRLTDKDINCEIDAVLITKTGIFPFAIRTSNGPSGIDNEGNYCWLDAETLSVKKVNVRYEQDNQKQIFQNILDKDPELHEIHPVLIIGGDNMFICQNQEDICFGHFDEIEEIIGRWDKEVFNQEEIDHIVRKITAPEVKLPKEKIRFRSPLVEDYCRLIMRFQNSK